MDNYYIGRNEPPTVELLMSPKEEAFYKARQLDYILGYLDEKMRFERHAFADGTGIAENCNIPKCPAYLQARYILKENDPASIIIAQLEKTFKPKD